MTKITQTNSIAGTVKKLCLMVLGMSAFAFALVPLYDLFCEVTGLNGKTGGPYTYDAAVTSPDRSRLVKVNFITNTNGGMVWDFWAEHGGVRVHPGELKEVKFFVRNTTGRVMVGQAIPSLVPISATRYFHKTECFCFSQQVLQPGEKMELPMRFMLDRALPKNVQTINLSYALFDVSDSMTDPATAGGE